MTRTSRGGESSGLFRTGSSPRVLFGILGVIVFQPVEQRLDVVFLLIEDNPVLVEPGLAQPFDPQAVQEIIRHVSPDGHTGGHGIGPGGREVRVILPVQVQVAPPGVGMPSRLADVSALLQPGQKSPPMGGANVCAKMGWVSPAVHPPFPRYPGLVALFCRYSSLQTWT